MASPEYTIFRPHKLQLSDIFRILILRRRPESSTLVVESTSPETESMHFLGCGNTNFTLILQQILLWFSVPMALFGRIIEFMFNFFSLNGGFLGVITNTIKGLLVIPKQESADFRSIIGHIDGRIELSQGYSILDLCIMASKIAYENQAFVERVVNSHWKMHLVQYYNFHNEFLNKNETQAFILCDRQEDAQLIVVAFRGTEPFNNIDWCTDVDLSWFSMGEMGKVHLGFMKALGLQDDKDRDKGWPKDYTGDHNLAYYTLREKLHQLIHGNKDAKILITGHSLGGALAILFPSLLILHKQDKIMSRLLGVYTFGQPRVGDADFGRFMKPRLDGIYRRFVYRYDIVPRVPFDNSYFQFSHFGNCVFYHNWYKGETLQEEPDRNLTDRRYLVSVYGNAWLDLFRALVVPITLGKDYTESCASLTLRIFGLLAPGFASHSLRDYINSVKLGNIS